MAGQGQKKLLPLGLENFERLRRENFYYIDKTGLIKILFQNWSQVTLFTRPRRFGKSLNMSMLKAFFEIGADSTLFDGLAIAKEQALCSRYLGRFPVISLTLKGVEGRSFQTAREMLCGEIGKEASRFMFLKESGRLDSTDKENYQKLISGETGKGTYFSMSDEVLQNSLKILSQLLAKHYGQRVILLIDEYDVPLNKAYQHGYYDEMTVLLRGVLAQVLKTNDSLQMAVLTGCLRISKESIFTGLNNLRVLTVMDSAFDEYFGFTDREVRELLLYYEVPEAYGTMKEWYDGYRFGESEVYCPWDVINYAADLRGNPEASPKDYWSNTSGNEIVRSLLQKGTAAVRRDLEALVAGESVRKTVRPELTYREIESSAENIWSVLFMTGYLTMAGAPDGKTVDLVIPNQEIRGIFTGQIQEWFQELASKEKGKLDLLCGAFLRGDAAAVEEEFGSWLRKTISIRDWGTRRELRESFYHGVLLGLLSHEEHWYIASNAESGDGFCDIRIEDEERLAGILIELKYAEDGDLDAACDRALAQMEEKRYADALLDDGMERILKYGIACYKKRCRVKCAS